MRCRFLSSQVYWIGKMSGPFPAEQHSQSKPKTGIVRAAARPKAAALRGGPIRSSGAAPDGRRSLTNDLAVVGVGWADHPSLRGQD